MSRTVPKEEALNLSTSSFSLSEASELDEDDVDDVKLKEIFSEEIKNYEVLDALPPTPQRPTTRSQAHSSLSPSASSTFSTSPCKSRTFESPIKKLSGSPVSSSCSRRKRSTRHKKSEKDICKELGIDVDDSELRDIENDEEEDRVHVDNVIEDLIDLGLGKKKATGRQKATTAEEEQLQRQFQKLSNRAPLEMNGDGRCTVLKEDIGTVKATLESVNALISVLEKTRDKLIKQDKELLYTEPPFTIRKQSKPKPSQGDTIL